jgi:transcription elongation factor Elf1
MGRRRRRRKIIRTRPTLPHVFQCPNCGAHALIVDVVDDKKKRVKKALIRCAECGLTYEFVSENPLMDRAYAYSLFIDKFYKGEVPVPEEE